MDFPEFHNINQPPATPPKVEPNAEFREFARNMRQMYQSLIDEHFTEEQAVKIIGQILAGVFGRGKE